MKMKKLAAAVACAAACVALMPGIANASAGPAGPCNVPSYSGNVPSYHGNVPSYCNVPSPDSKFPNTATPSYDGNFHAPSAGYVDGTKSAPINLGGVTVNVIGHGGDIKVPTVTDTQASNAKFNDGWASPASKSLVVEPTSYKGATSATLIFNLGEKYEGAEVKVFAQHGDGTTDVYTGSKVSDKLSTVEIGKFSVFTVAVKVPAKDDKGNDKVKQNNSKTSPDTALTVSAIAEFFSKLF